MLTEISLFTILSTVILFSFISLGVIRFGLLPSYSSYSEKWGEAVPMNNMNLWSVVTFIASFLLCPVMIQLAVGSAWQFLGFLTPVYLMAVSLTPDWYKDKKLHIIHTVAALLCVAGSSIWMILIMHALKIIAISAVLFLTTALFTGTVKSSAVFWLEMWLFVSTYLTVLFAIF